MAKKRLGIIVPYRNRPKQLRQFIEGLGEFFARTVKNYIPSVYIIEQKDSKDFNRGKLLNVGFIQAEKDGCDYVVFHDIDMLPLDVNYNFKSYPQQLANRFETNTAFKRTINDDYFGGVTMFSMDTFRKINGYSNKYRGWGFEDNDLLYRCQVNDISLGKKTYKSYARDGKAFRFNGVNSMVKIPNNFTYARPLTFVVSFNPAKIKCDNDEITDEYAVFAVPGEDLNLSYNSFKTYKFEAFLSSNEAVSITSKTLPNMPCRAVVTLDSRNKQMHFYLNGTKIGRNLWKKFNIKKYSNEPFMYLGVGDPKRKTKQKWFRGTIDEFAVYDKILSGIEIRELCTNTNIDLREDKGRYLSSKNLKTYYRADSYETVVLEERKNTVYLNKEKTVKSTINNDIVKHKLIDLSGNRNHGDGLNLKVVDTKHCLQHTIDVPHKRYGYFKLLPHEEQGYTLGFWKNWKSRVNQLRYYDIINQGRKEYINDGLTTCKYKILRERDLHYGDIYKIRTKVISIRS